MPLWILLAFLFEVLPVEWTLPSDPSAPVVAITPDDGAVHTMDGPDVVPPRP